eukprot:sb/3471690/
MVTMVTMVTYLRWKERGAKKLPDDYSLIKLQPHGNGMGGGRSGNVDIVTTVWKTFTEFIPLTCNNILVLQQLRHLPGMDVGGVVQDCHVVIPHTYLVSLRTIIGVHHKSVTTVTMVTIVTMEPTVTSKQPIKTRYVGHVTGYQISANQGSVFSDSVGSWLRYFHFELTVNEVLFPSIIT